MNEEKKKKNINKVKNENTKGKVNNKNLKNKQNNALDKKKTKDVLEEKKTTKNIKNKLDSKENKNKTKKEEIVEVENVKEETVKEEKDTTLLKDNNDKVEKKESKVGLIIILVILLAIIGACVYYEINNKDSNTEQSSELMDEFYKYYNSKKVKVIYYASSTCGYCKLETPIMEQISKDYDVDYLYIDSNNLSASDRNKILKELNIEHATPTTVIVKNGEVLDTQIGYADGSAMVDFFIKNKVLEKDATYSPEKNLTFIDYDEYKKLLTESGKYVVTIGQTGCSHCTATKPVLNKIAQDYDIEINYLNLTEMTQSEVNDLTNNLEEIGYDDEDFIERGSFGTPLTLIIKNGKVISYVIGERPTVEFVRAFKKSGVISE